MSASPLLVPFAVPEELVDALATRLASLLNGRGDRQTRWLTLEEAAEHLRLTPHALRKLVQRGQIPTFQPNGRGTRHYFDRDELDDWIRAGRLGT
ncbi:MAG: helix-turn-helix domain-containing protein [Gaiellaceae bacterium]